MLLSWGPVVKLRNVARSLGITRVIGKLRSSSKYEERFGSAMIGALHPRNTVCRMGANVIPVTRAH